MGNLISFFFVLILVILLYLPSFTSPFFQDDFLFLTSDKISDLFTDIPRGVYRPLSFQIFYSAMKNLFGYSPVVYHLVLFIFFMLTLILIVLLSRKIFQNDFKALTVAFFYALNVSLFADFYWIATSYVVLGGFFTFLTLYLYWSDKPLFLSLLSFIFGLFSNELVFTLPLLLIVTGWFFGKWKKSLFLFLALDVAYIALKIFFVGLPQSTSYTLKIGSFPSVFRWYFFRALNLPEGIKRSGNLTLYFLFFIFIALLLLAALYLVKTRQFNFRLIIFGLIWFISAALPFFFIPGHMSSFYLTVSLFGTSLIFADLLSFDSRILFFSLIIYLILTLRGLEFLSKTHWIILKNTL